MAAKKAEKPEGETKLVKMVRDPEQYPEPHSADIHPDEVANCEGIDGWTKA